MVPATASAYPSTNALQPMQTAVPPAAIMQLPGVMMPSPALSSIPLVPSAAGFMPVSPPLQQQVAAQEPRSPQAAGNTSAPSCAPPATVQTADTSNVAGNESPNSMFVLLVCLNSWGLFNPVLPEGFGTVLMSLVKCIKCDFISSMKFVPEEKMRGMMVTNVLEFHLINL